MGLIFKRGVLYFWIVISLALFIPILVFALGGEEDPGAEESKGLQTTPLGESSFFTADDPNNNNDRTILTIPTAIEEDESYTQLVGEFTGTLQTADWEAQGTFSNLIIGNGGLYEATITGIAAGTTIYFLSSFDDQIFELKAGSDESDVRIIQFQKNGSLQDRIYMEVAQGDRISHGSMLEDPQYHFQAYDNNAVYIYN